VPEEALLSAGVEQKYVLTVLGKQELDENAYVPYMHSHPHKTLEIDCFGTMFNVWSINNLLGNDDKSNWKAIVDEQERILNKEMYDKHATFMKELKKTNQEEYKKLKAQDNQLEAINTAKAKYNETKDIDSYLSFWEKLWATGGLKFEGSKWHFELPDLYIKVKRYEDALAYVEKLKKEKPFMLKNQTVI
jgi:tetratricopeptide (TPR) repeat protein